jgi:L-asparaginase II
MNALSGNAVPMVELWRGGMLESTHLGHAVICDAGGAVVEAWGDPALPIYPRSSSKMLQALPLVESGAADAAGLTERQLAFACASHLGSAMHVAAAADWLASLGLGEPDLRCGSHEPSNREERNRLIREGEAPCQLHNNCSGKHSGFLTLNRHLGGGTEYIEVDHPVQVAVKAAFEEVTGEDSPGFGIDGCSAPNFATSVEGLARAMGRFAGASDSGDTRSRAMHRLATAMATYPEMVSGEGGACTELMRAMGGRVAIKGGAEGVYVAILPEQKLGIALKIIDGSDRAKDAAVAALLVRAGVLAVDHPATLKHLEARVRNWRGTDVGVLRAAPGFPG